MVDLEQEFDKLIIGMYENIRNNKALDVGQANQLAEMVKTRTGYDALSNLVNAKQYDEYGQDYADEGWSSSGCSW